MCRPTKAAFLSADAVSLALIVTRTGHQRPEIRVSGRDKTATITVRLTK